MKRKLSGLYMLLMLVRSNTLIWCLRYVSKTLSHESFSGNSCMLFVIELMLLAPILLTGS
jgi:hypothetical protein